MQLSLLKQKGLEVKQYHLRATNETTEAVIRQYDALLLWKRNITCSGCEQVFPGGPKPQHCRQW